MTLNFAKHLPPSVDLPKVLALDPASAANLPPEINLTLSPGTATDTGPFDAIVGTDTGLSLAGLFRLLRGGGRVILAASNRDSQALLNDLNAAGFIHCLVETEDGHTLYRGERPPLGTPLERIEALASSTLYQPPDVSTLRFIFLLVAQTPNKPAWRLAAGETLTWQAATVLDAQTNQPVLLAFSSLVRAVKFMQPAVLAQKFKGINKVGKFPSAAAPAWQLPFLLNPEFDDLRHATPGPMLTVDPQGAITGDE